MASLPEGMKNERQKKIFYKSNISDIRSNTPVYIHLQLAETHLGPVTQDLVLEILGEGAFEVSSLPITSGGVLGGHEGIGDNFATLGGGAIAVAHVGNEREAAHVLEEDLVQVGAAASGEGPHHILAVVDINVVTHKHQAVDGVACLVVEDQVTNALGEVLGVSLHFTKTLSVDTQSDPGDLRLEGSEGISNGEAIELADLADLSSSESANHGVLWVNY